MEEEVLAVDLEWVLAEFLGGEEDVEGEGGEDFGSVGELDGGGVLEGDEGPAVDELALAEEEGEGWEWEEEGAYFWRRSAGW